MAVIVVRGTGDVGSAVAHLLYRAGHSVVLHDIPAPSHSRRRMAFVDALYEGKAELAGVLAKRAKDLSSVKRMLRCRQAVPVVDDPLERVLETVKPRVLVDARMRKHDHPETQRGLAPLTIGLGPNFRAGENTDIAVETAWGNNLGKVVWSGGTQDLTGEPQEIDGHARDRYIYAPNAGVFSTKLRIGDLVVKGQEIARIDDVPLYSPLSGSLRGLIYDAATVKAGTKVIEVDPRGDPNLAQGLGTRPARIAEGVLEAVQKSPASDITDDGKTFGVSALIGVLGGLIGLGGAEFRLPALVGLFKFDVRQAIFINVLISLATVTSSLVFRSSMHGGAPLVANFQAVLVLVFGSLLGAYAGSSLVRNLNTRTLHHAVGVMLIGLSVVMAAHGLFAHVSAAPIDIDSGLVLTGVVVGTGIGMVGSMLGVAGGELLIPTLVLLFGIDIKSAGTLSLTISIPMLLLTFWRMSGLPAAHEDFRHKRFITVMVAGSLCGAFIGSGLAGIVPQQGVSLILALILLVSAVKTFSK